MSSLPNGQRVVSSGDGVRIPHRPLFRTPLHTNTNTTMSTEKIKQALKRKPKKEPTIKRSAYLSTGCAMLNVAITGKPFGGISKGKYLFVVGDSASGKTFLVIQLLAEAANNEFFNDYNLIYDNVEDGALMDMQKFFGAKLTARLRPPKPDTESPYSETIEDFYYNLDDAMKEGPCIYILDSMDALSSNDEEKKFKANKKARNKGEETTGSYGDGKAKKNSSMLRRCMGRLKATGSILVIVNQTRDNIGGGPFMFEKKTRSGGHALKFYAHAEIWLSIKERLKKDVRGKKRTIGVRTTIKVKKNRYTGRESTVYVPIYYSSGFDDTGSCVEFLIEEKHWVGNKTKVKAPEFDFDGKIEALIQHIEENDLTQDLHALVSTVWNEIEESKQVKRKARYE